MVRCYDTNIISIAKLRRDDVRIAMTDPETVKQILFMVGYDNPDMRTGAIECVVALLKHGKFTLHMGSWLLHFAEAFKAFKSSISTPTSLVKIDLG